MINKVYDKFIMFIKEFKWYFIFFIILFVCDNVYLPYYIEAPGGLNNVSDKLEVVDGTTSSGTYNMAYVSEYKVNIMLYLYSFFNKDWDLVTIKEENGSESEESVNIRGSMMMDSSINNAKIVAFSKAGKDYEIISVKNYVSYVVPDAKTDLQVGDEIVSIGDILIEEVEDIRDVISKYNVGDTIYFKVLNDGKEYERYATIYEEDGKVYVGISLEVLSDVKTSVEVIDKLDGNESGPSGGLMMSLYIYDSLIEEDLTHNLKIAGTGTIDSKGNVGEISGVEYKIKGAVKKKADIFFIPEANYDEAKKVVDENNYDIALIKVKIFDDAINYLKGL